MNTKNDRAFGIFDTNDKLWLGDDNGPKLFRSSDVINGRVLGDDAETFARIAAQVNDLRQGWGLGRSRALPFTESAVVLKDELTHRMTAREALKRIVSGTDI